MRLQKAAIVGGGIAGLLTAYLLRKNGFLVTLYEAFPNLRPAGAGLTLWPNATRILKSVELLDGLLPYGRVANYSEIRSQDGKILVRMPLDDYDSPAIGISRFDLLRFLTFKLGDENIKYNHRCIGYEQNGQEVTIQFENGITEHADLLIGADGIHSIIRKQINPQPLRYSGYTSWRGMAAFSHELLRSGTMFEAWGKGTRFGFVPLSDEKVYWFATKNAAPGTDLTDKQFVASLFSQFFEPIPSVIGATLDCNLIQTDIYDRVPSLPYVDRRVILLGDAAHPSTPNLGQGACLAIEDSFYLAQTLSRNKDTYSDLFDFQNIRWKRTSSIVKQSWNWGRYTQVEGSVSSFLRNLTTSMTPSIFQKRMWDSVFNDQRSDG